MNEYDTVLKALLRDPASLVLEQMSGTRVVRWLPIELPKVENLRMDLLGEALDGELLHLELQSTNYALMPLRVAEYALRALRVHGRLPRQFVLYVGEAAISMPRELIGLKLRFEYELVDIRELDAEALLESPRFSDNVMAILGRLGNRRETLRRILKRIAESSGEERGVQFQQLSILAGLRRLGENIRQEARQMPILNDIMEHDLLGPAIRQGMEQGMERVVRRQIEKRFGPMPAKLEAKFSTLTATQLDELALRVIDARDMDDLFS